MKAYVQNNETAISLVNETLNTCTNPDEELILTATRRMLNIYSFADNQTYPNQIVHTMLLLHGKNTCKASPQCDRCFLQDRCSYYLEDDNRPKQIALF